MTGRMELFDRSRRGFENGPAGPELGYAAAARPVDSRVEKRAERLAGRLGGERIREGRSSVLRVRTIIPLGFTHGDVDLGLRFPISPSALRVLFPRAGDISGGFVFFDIETTGLSGGAGTLVFLAGTLRLKGGGIELTQYFLENLASEKLFLSLLSEELGSGSALVSYNGRSFDSNIIRNRLILNGFRPQGPEPLHLDLLYPARRIWRGRLPDFTLQTLERRILGLKRSGDIPGHRIPEVYFGYLGARDPGEEIPSVFEHNKTDTLSLLALFTKQLALVGELIEGRGRAVRQGRPPVSYNPATLSDMLARSEFGAEARRLLAAHSGDPEALRRLGFLCKREKLFSDATEAFRAFVERANCAGPMGFHDYVEACTELSKLFEHGLRDLAEAKLYAELALRRIERAAVFSPGEGGKLARAADELRKRLLRVNRKLGRG